MASRWMDDFSSYTNDDTNENANDVSNGSAESWSYEDDHISVEGNDDVVLVYGENEYEHTDSEGEAEESCADNMSQMVGYDSNVDHDHEPFVDIESFEDQQKAPDNYWKIMSKTLNSDSEWYDFYNNYANQRGFSIRKEGLKRRKGGGKEIRLRKFVCSREGKRQKERLTMEGRTRRLRLESRCNCKAELTVGHSDHCEKVCYCL
ncbi:unnamed protein product [Alopecurus aequalis]